ncbi:hypothetical protein OKA05_04580 [Luteolibacter arcticus]|uniref:LPS export ABC transporter periplasmic protein LptC n=1 Tax=Luteolibacter arcticus TaxID=1581411 RepID=A0ABT3GET1_9BACT|nr:hypothetical protein [Luteolibacter arcticus]MCW1921815.1 hypothetical protein [Luteolibacter arcticus]
MSEKKSSGCVVAAVVGIVVLVGGLALVATLIYRGAVFGKEAMSAQFEKHRAEASKAMAEAAAVEPVKLTEGELPDYSSYQAGQPLTREMFLAWRSDTEATTLVQDTFREKAEGADVSWNLRAGDLRQEGDRIIGSFYLPYVTLAKDGIRTQTGVESLRCEFAAGERESLLNIRRDSMATIRGKLSLKNGETVLRDARQAGTGVEKE